MPDYGHDLLFGVFVPPLAQQADAVLALARRADDAGLELHPATIMSGATPAAARPRIRNLFIGEPFT